MNETSDLDRKAVRLQFSRRTGRISQADFLLRDIEGRMVERLDLVRVAPRHVLDAGCGLGAGAARLQQRYPQARVMGIDLADAMVFRAAQLHGELARRSFSERLRKLFGAGATDVQVPDFAVADAARLPVRNSTFDLVWSNLALHWFGDPAPLFEEWRRAMQPGALLMFSTFGADTLTELRNAGIVVPGFADLHDLGDALLVSGFSGPVIDAERLRITWTDPGKLLSELRAFGGWAAGRRGGGLRGRKLRAALIDQIAALADSDGCISVSVEVVFGHAWVPEKVALPAGYAPIRFERGGTA